MNTVTVRVNRYRPSNLRILFKIVYPTQSHGENTVTARVNYHRPSNLRTPLQMVYPTQSHGENTVTARVNYHRPSNLRTPLQMVYPTQSHGENAVTARVNYHRPSGATLQISPLPGMTLAACTALILAIHWGLGWTLRAMRSSSLEYPGIRMLYVRSKTSWISRISRTLEPRSLALRQAACSTSSTNESARLSTDCVTKFS